MRSVEPYDIVRAEHEPGAALRDFVSVVRRGFPLAMIVAFVAAASAYWISGRLEPIYRATATLLVSDTRPSNQFGVTLLTAPALAPSAYRAAVHSVVVLDDTLSRLGSESSDAAYRTDIADRTGLDVEVDDPSTIFRIWADHADPVVAAAIANALAESLRAWDQQRARANVEAMIAALEGNLAALDTQLQRALSAEPVDQFTVQSLRDQRADNMVSLETARALRSSAVGYVELLEPALAPTEPRFPSPVRNTVMAFGLGLALAYVMVVARIALDTRFRNPDDVVEATGGSLLAVFQKTPDGNLPKETANFLRANVLSQLSDVHPKVILVTSARAGEGKTSVAISLAESLARSHYRTLLVDGDLRRPSVARAYSLPGVRHSTLETLLRDPDAEVKPSVVRMSAATLHVLAGKTVPSNPSELIAAGFEDAIERLKPNYDAIVVDSAPLLPVADSLSLVPHVSATILVVNLSQSDRKAVSAAIRLLRNLDTRLLGTVVTGATRGSSNGSEYGYGYEARGRVTD